MYKQLLLLLLFCSSLVVSGQNTSIKTVLAAEQTRFDAMISRDTNALKRLLSDDLVYIHSNALKENKQEHLRTIGSGKIVYQSMNREEVTVRFYGKTAVNSGAIRVKGILNGNPFDLRMLYTAVYRKNKRTWKLVNWQSTRIP